MPRGRADPVVKERLEALEDRMPKLHSPWKRQVKYWKFQNHRKGFGQGFWIVLDRSFTRIHFSYCRGCLLIYCCCVYSQIWFILDSTWWLKTHLSFQHTVCQYTHQTRRFVDPIFWLSDLSPCQSDGPSDPTHAPLSALRHSCRRWGCLCKSQSAAWYL